MGATRPITERRRAEQQIRILLPYDALTDLPNRVLFPASTGAGTRANRRGEQLAVLYMTLLNSTASTDSLVIPQWMNAEAVASRLRVCVRRHGFRGPALARRILQFVQTGIEQPCDVVELVKRIYAASASLMIVLGIRLRTGRQHRYRALGPNDGTDLDQL